MKRSKMKNLSHQMRQAITNSGMTRYAIAKAIDMDHATMSRFMNGKGGLSIENLDALFELLGLKVTAETQAKRPKGR